MYQTEVAFTILLIASEVTWCYKIFCCNSVHFSQLMFFIVVYDKMMMTMTITLIINDDDEDVVRTSPTPSE